MDFCTEFQLINAEGIIELEKKCHFASSNEITDADNGHQTDGKTIRYSVDGELNSHSS